MKVNGMYVCMYVVNEKKEKGNNYRKGRSAKGWVQGCGGENSPKAENTLR